MPVMVIIQISKVRGFIVLFLVANVYERKMNVYYALKRSEAVYPICHTIKQAITK